MARAAVFIGVAAIVVFAVVQDRVTGEGVGRYVAMSREAVPQQRRPVTIDEVMKPAVARGVQQGSLWAGAVLVTGFGGVWIARRRRRG
jgi:hypothetical protein